MRLSFPKFEEDLVGGRIWIPSMFERANVALAGEQRDDVCEVVSSAGVVTSGMHAMRDGYFGAAQGKSIRPVTVAQEVVGKLMAGDFVGSARGGVLLDRGLTGRKFVYAKVCSAYGDGGRCYVEVDTRVYGEDSHGSGRDVVGRKGVRDRCSFLPFDKKYRSDGEGDVLDWIAIEEGGGFIHDS